MRIETIIGTNIGATPETVGASELTLSPVEINACALAGIPVCLAFDRNRTIGHVVSSQCTDDGVWRAVIDIYDVPAYEQCLAAMPNHRAQLATAISFAVAAAEAPKQDEVEIVTTNVLSLSLVSESNRPGAGWLARSE